MGGFAHHFGEKAVVKCKHVHTQLLANAFCQIGYTKEKLLLITGLLNQLFVSFVNTFYTSDTFIKCK